MKLSTNQIRVHTIPYSSQLLPLNHFILNSSMSNAITISQCTIQCYSFQPELEIESPLLVIVCLVIYICTCIPLCHYHVIREIKCRLS